MSNKEVLRIISNETKDSIDQLKVVTPSVYASIFTKYAMEHNIDIEDENGLAKELLAIECSNLRDMQEQTSKNAQKLSENTNKALEAIKDKDEKQLHEVLKETEDLRREVEKLKESVYKDELTNTHNRKWLHDKLLEDDSNNFKENGTLAIIDLNYFKTVNDTFGHIIGDKVLIYIANALKSTRHNVVRYGGDEFIVIFSKGITLSQAISSLNSLREEIIAKKLKAQEASFRVSFSFGVNEFRAGDNLTKIIESADKNMYRDKVEIKKRVIGI